MSVAMSLGQSISGVWRGLARTNTKRALVLCVMLGGLIALGFYASREPLSGPQRGHSGSGVADPYANFNETHVGSLVISSPASDNCKLLQFDNKTGAFQDAGERFCGRTPEDEAPSGTDRVRKMIRSFQR